MTTTALLVPSYGRVEVVGTATPGAIVSFIEDALFPTDISDGSEGGPNYNTGVSQVESGYERRRIRWLYPKHDWDVAYGVRDADQLERLLRFFHAMRGKGHGFRYRDPLDHKSCGYNATPTATDQLIYVAAGGETAVQLVKNYTEYSQTLVRLIRKPVADTVLVAKNGTPLTPTTDFSVAASTGMVSFSTPLVDGDEITAGYEFHVPCRFAVDKLRIRLESDLIGDTSVPVVEIRT